MDNAYEQGYNAFGEDKRRTQNPYQKETEEWRQWNDGWIDAANGE
jgi:ribosome modulation factor